MPESEEIIRRRCEMFESCCKTVLRNYARDLERAARRCEDREIPTDAPLEYVCAETDDEDSHTILCRGVPCVITDETLYATLLSLSEHQRDVIFCGRWLNMTDTEIASLYGVTVRTIYNWRRSAIRRIMGAYEQGAAIKT